MEIFTDKIAVVTGGASGIGRALGEELARRHATVILADVNTGLLEETVESITKAGCKAKGVTLDVSDFDAVKRMVEDTAAEYGRLDYIFNNAGIGIIGDARDVSYDDWRAVIDTNLWGVINGVLAAYPIMAKQGSGHIINTASLAGLIPAPGVISYTTSKYGIVGLSNALRIEGANLGVKVSVVCPGLIETPILHTSKSAKFDLEKALEPLPEGMSPEKCARVILRGVKRNKATIVVTFLAKLAWLGQRNNPGLMLWLGKQIWKRLEKMRIKD